MLAVTRSVHAQVPPNAAWRTLRTPHFHVHFTPPLEDIARRAAAHAETAYVQLSRHLHPPRGPIDMVIADNVDYANGYATPFPNNRIVIYANPAITESALRFVDDPIHLVVTHELVHTFQVDRSGGIWKVLQLAFGRSPFLFPNGYKPSWLLEGTAVHYETLLTGSGRIAGSEHRMIARTAGLAHRVPRLDQLSLANPTFPYGQHTYAYGSLFMRHLAETHGDSALRTFVESSARQLIPWWLNGPSKRAFGRSFTAEYARWAASLVAEGLAYVPPMPAWRDLTVEGAYANFPRWLNDSTLIYSGTGGRETYGAWTVTLGRQRERVGRRHSESPNSVMADGSLLYSQLEWTSPYHLRSDLYIDRAGGGSVRLTHGARLSTPESRGDSLIVAVETIPGGTRLALVSHDGTSITPITRGGPDEQWLEPRWSPDGRHIVAARWLRGGTAQIVVVDTTGRIVQTLVSERAVSSAPSWSPDGHYVYFSSDRDGIANLYRASFVGSFADSMAIPGIVRVSDAQTGLFEAQPAPARPSLAAVVFRADGYHVGVAPLDSARVSDAATLATVTPRAAAAIAPADAPDRPYSPWRSLVPRYWMPFFEEALSPDRWRYGAFTSSEDVVGRHAYTALLFVPSDNSGLTGSFTYRNASLGRPVIEFVGAQSWENWVRVRDTTAGNPLLGTLRRRIRDAALAFTFERPRARTYASFTFSAGLEVHDYAGDSAGLMERLDARFSRAHYIPLGAATMAWSNTQVPPHAFSPEDGVTLATTIRSRWRTSGDAGTPTSGLDNLLGTRGSLSVVGATSAFKSLDLPGYAHHVLALRVAGGAVDSKGTSFLEVGGLSGSVVDLLPGYALGEGRRTFGVRGFPEGALIGMRAMTGSIEYRAPVKVFSRGLGPLPLFLGRTSLTTFGDVGSAWCPGTFPSRSLPAASLCTQAHYDVGRTTAVGEQPLVYLSPTWIGSVGTEFNADAAIFNWDRPLRWRLGAVLPVINRERSGSEERWGAYFTVGVSF